MREKKSCNCGVREGERETNQEGRKMKPKMILCLRFWRVGVSGKTLLMCNGREFVCVCVSMSVFIAEAKEKESEQV